MDLLKVPAFANVYKKDVLFFLHHGENRFDGEVEIQIYLIQVRSRGTLSPPDSGSFMRLFQFWGVLYFPIGKGVACAVASRRGAVSLLEELIRFVREGSRACVTVRPFNSGRRKQEYENNGAREEGIHEGRLSEWGKTQGRPGELKKPLGKLFQGLKAVLYPPSQKAPSGRAGMNAKRVSTVAS